MANQIFMRVNEVAEELGVSIPYAYKLIRQLNEELAKTGCITISGRIDRKFFHEKFYGTRTEKDCKEGAIMAAFKNKNNGTWYVQFRYTDWKGERQQKLKRGFATKKEALAWEREFLMQKQADIDMTFESFVELYEKDVKPKLKLNTWLTKESIIKKKILPYFAKRKLSEITAKDIIHWQNEIRELTDWHGKPLSKTYLKTVHNQLSAIFNHAARFYGLNINPARQAGNMGTEERKEMLFWTREEYTKFSEAMMDKPLSFYAFEMLYWCGLREGELLALTPADFNFEKRTVSINKSYQRLNKQDVITDPKTPKSNRVIQMPKFLCDEIQDYLKQLYGVQPDSRMFPISKSYLHREMDRGCKATGVKRIRIHDLRHPYVKPTTKKFLSFFKFEMAISLRAFLCFALLLGIKEGPQLVPFIR